MDEAKYREVEGRLWASVGRAPKEHFVQLPRIGVSVRVQDVGDGPPVLLAMQASIVSAKPTLNEGGFRTLERGESCCLRIFSRGACFGEPC